MGIFSSIKEKIFGKKEEAPTPTAPAPSIAPSPAAATPAAAPAAAPVSVIDVEESLSRQAASHSESLNWRTSIVDLMKLLGIDPSLANRKELAQELGYTGELNGSAEMNIWLHKAVMRELAANGGKVPSDLTD